MADPLDFLNTDEEGQALARNPPVPAPDLAPAPAPVQAPQPVLDEQPAIAQQSLEQAPAPAPDPLDFLSGEGVGQEVGQAPVQAQEADPLSFLSEPERPSPLEATGGAVLRSSADLYRLMTATLPATAQEQFEQGGVLGQLGLTTPDPEVAAAARASKEAFAARDEGLKAEIKARFPEPVFPNFTEITSLDDAKYWAVERLGEQAPILAATMLSGGAGAGIAAISGGLKLTPAVGAAIGAYLSSTFLETASIADESKEATGSFQSATAVPAGMGAGALEVLTPFKFLRAVGQGDIWSMIRTPLREGITEFGQEVIATAAREWVDPNYNFFSKETGIRLVEATAAGTFVGGVVGGAGTVLTAGPRKEREQVPPPIPPEPSPQGPIARGPGPAPPRPGPQEGPLAWLRTRARKKVRTGEIGPEGRTTPVEDPIETNYLDDELNRDWKSKDVQATRLERLLDFEDDNIPRYAIVGQGETQIHTAAGLEEELARRAPLAEKPRIRQVNMDSLQPGAITADVFDLPPAGDQRIWFMPGVSEQEKADIEAVYPIVQSRIQAAAGQGRLERGGTTRQEAEAQYQELLNRGLRVIPSRGEGFSYNGIAEVEGKELSEVPPTTRSVQVFELDSNTLELVPLEKDEATLQRLRNGKVPNLEPVAIDLSKIPEGTIQELPDGRLQLTKPIPEGALTFGYPIMGDAFLAPWSPRVIAGKPNSLEIVKSPHSFQRSRDNAQRAANWIKEFQPFLLDMQKRLGVKHPVKYMILEARTPTVVNAASSMVYTYSKNAVIYNAWAQETVVREDTKEGFLLSLLHEIGHAVTINSWFSLDPVVKAKVYEGYKRALLRNRIRGDYEHVRTSFHPRDAALWQEPTKFYYLTFTEYLAEQFRRWSISNREALGSDERFLRSVGKQLASLYTEYNDQISQDAARSMFVPDYTFTTWMDYLLAMRDKPESPMKLSRRLTLTNNVPIPADMQVAYAQVVEAMEEFGYLVPAGTRVETALFEEGESAETQAPLLGYFDHKSRTLKMFIGALAKHSGQDVDLAAKTVVHEMWHAVERSLTDEEHNLLVETSKREGIMPPQVEASYRREYNEHLKRTGFDPKDYQAEIQRWLDQEHIAFLIEDRFRGRDFGTESNTILDKIIDFYNRVIQVLTGNGWKTPDDVLKAFYRAEFTDRTDYARAAAQEMRFEERKKSRQVPGELQSFEGLQVSVVKGQDSSGKAEGNASYEFYTEPTDPFDVGTSEMVGYITLVEEKGVGWDIEMIRVFPKFGGKGHQLTMLKFAQQDLQTRLQASGTLTMAGHRMLQRIAPDQIKFHVFDPIAKLWVSPKQVQLMIKASVLAGNDARVKVLKKMKDSIPREAFADPELDKKFSRQPERLGLSREYERSQHVSDSSLVEATTGVFTQPEDFTDTLNSDMAEQPSAANEALGNILTWFQTGDKNPETRRLIGAIRQEADRINWFSKMFFNILQLGYRNPHIAPLTRYIATMEQFNAKRMFWVQKADEVAKAWDALPRVQRDAVADMSFWATEMRYLTPQERRQNVVRNPTPQEMVDESRRIGMTRGGAQVFARVMKSFQDFLNDLEDVTIRGIQRRLVGQPQQMQAAIAEVQADMAALRQKPYFPFVRFGQFHITVRNQFSNNRVIHFSTYATARERDAALTQVTRQNAGFDTKIGKIPENVHEFMGLPTTLLKQVKANLPGITQQQVEWMEQFESMMAPERSFRKRFLRRKGTPGYSLDGMRVYAHYFRSGANYLARVEYKEQLDDEVRDMEARGKTLKDSTRNSKILDYMRKHLDFVMKGGNDWARFKALTAIWQLGLSPAAAALNLTQIPVVTWPYITARYGEGAGTKELFRVMSAAKRTFGKPPPGQTADFLQAREEMIAQGKIDIGQAPELGGFAEGSNLTKLQAGTKAQRWWRNFTWFSMWGFQHAETFNRELTFAAAYKLALDQSNSNRWLLNFALEHNTEVNELMARRQMTHAQAVATLAGREAIQKTQYEYSPYARPTFLRGGPASAFLVFFQFTQNMLFSMAFNPGKVKMWAVFLTLYGLSGLPGAEDMDAFVRFMARKFKLDFSPKMFAREKVREWTKGTIFDQVGPDLAMHGMSRYSYGLGLLADGWGAPQFDASGNGSMGRIIPGFSEGLRTWANGGGWKDFTAEVTRDVAGAGFGQFFQMLQMMESDPFSGDGTWKKWERSLPRGLKAMSRAGRYMVEGGDVDPKTGSNFVHFNMNDPDDRNTLVAQALGFTPRKVTEKWEAIRAADDVAKFYESRKAHLLLQFFQATRSGEKEVIGDVMSRVKQYNKELADYGVPELGITANTLRQSRAARERVRQSREALLPTQKSQIRLQQSVFENFPGVMVEQKKVR